MKSVFRKLLLKSGYDLVQIPPRSANLRQKISDHRQLPSEQPSPLEPAWPLPLNGTDSSNEELMARFDAFSYWHYGFSFEGGLDIQARHQNATSLADAPQRPLQRYRHFMPYLLQACGGSLKGLRVLDIGCNSGFWSLQCGLLGAEVVGFDARPDLIEQANLIRSMVGLDNVEFTTLDFWDMSPAALGGTFDVVLNLGILYHLPRPLEVLETTFGMSDRLVLLDTGVLRADQPLVRFRWEEPTDIRMAATAGVISNPSPQAIDLMLLHLRANRWFQIPLRPSVPMPADYENGFRASWLIEK